VRLFDSRLRRDADRNSNAGVPVVVQVVTVANVVYVNVVGFVPILCPVSRPRVKATEPIAAVLKPGIPAYNHEGKVVDAEPVTPTVIATKVRVRDAVAVIAAALTPSAVVGLPVAGPMSLPSATLHPLLCGRDPLLSGLLLGRLLLLLLVLGLLSAPLLLVLGLLLLLSTLLGLLVLSLLLLLSTLLGLLVLGLLLLLLGVLLRLLVLVLLLSTLLGLLVLGLLLLLLGVLLLLLWLGALLFGLGWLLLALLLLWSGLLRGLGLLLRRSLVFALLLMLCACRNCGRKSQEQNYGADDSNWLLLSALLP